MAFLDTTGLQRLWAHIITKLGDKVDKVSDKGLSTNDYTTEEKNKLAGIADGAEVNVNADWNATSGDSQILNKPTIPSKTSQLTNDSGFITSSDIPEGSVASTTTPKMDGTASVGTETAFARGDHVHPSDTTKVDKVDGKGLSTNDFTDTYKTKLDGIEDGANKTIIDSALSSTSTNPVQNKVINTAINNCAKLASSNSFSETNFFEKDVYIGTAGELFDDGKVATMIDIDTAIAGIRENDFDFLGNVYFSNPIRVGTPTTDAHAATKKYVDDLVSTKTENIKTGTGTNSLYMNNTSSLTEPDDGGDLHTAETTSEAPQANGTGSFAIGVGTKAEGDVSVAEGIKTTAGYLRDDGTRNVGSHAEGVGTFAKSSASHAEGYYTKSLASNSHTEGFFNTVESTAWSGHAEGRENTVTGVAAHAEGHGNTVSGANAHAEGDGNIAEGENSHAEGNDTTAHGEDSHAEGYGTAANGSYSHAEGYTSIALATYSHAEGYNTEASGRASHAEGISSSSGAKTTASGRGSHAEGVGTSASGEGSHSEGGVTTASGNYSHAEGYKTTASALYAHAEGARSTASAAAAHSEGADTTASGECAHAEGKLNTASGKYSHVGGYGNTSANFAGTVIGQYAKVSTASATKYNSTSEAFVIGNGTADDARSNAFEVLFDGTVKANDKQLATQEYVDNSVSTKAPAYQYSTTDLTAGTSTLATGTLYFVYE